MSLVAYASSDSEGEQDDAASTSNFTAPTPKKTRETVKITIPSLQEFKDEDVKPEPKKLKPKSGSGLFSILPPPKHSASSTTESFTPYVLTKKKEPKTVPSAAKNVRKESTAIERTPPESSDPDSSSNAHEESSAPIVDYFSFGDSSDKYETADPQIGSKSVLFSSLPQPAQNSEFYEAPSSSYELPSYSDTVVSDEKMEKSFFQQSWDENYQNPLNQASAQTLFYNDEGFKKIKGRRDTDNIEIVDVNAADQLTGKDQWLMKSLTEETAQVPSKRRHGMPTQQQKRKHQITYLAFQAKERELDLKNQWSLNSLTRRETQAKYGF